MKGSITAVRRALHIVAIALSVGGATSALAQATGPSMVVLVRHAEKASATDPDPSLSDAGRARAEALAAALTHSPPSVIVVSARKRTAETAAPIATKLGLTSQAISLDGPPTAHVAAVAAAVRRARGVVLVVGHSNTVPAIIKALGGPSLPDICDASYATLYVLQLARDGQPARLVLGQYGASDPVGATACAGMVPK